MTGWNLWSCWKEDAPTGVFYRKKSVKNYLDENRDYVVPKRKLGDVVTYL